jgi:hypothetical protein
LELTKHVFRVHGVDAWRQVALRKQLGRNQVLNFFSRQPVWVVAVEACSRAHF